LKRGGAERCGILTAAAREDPWQLVGANSAPEKRRVQGHISFAYGLYNGMGEEGMDRGEPGVGSAAIRPGGKKKRVEDLVVGR